LKIGGFFFILGLLMIELQRQLCLASYLNFGMMIEFLCG